MESEIHNIMKVWLTVIISLIYCYMIGKIIPKGFKRLFVLLPIICIFLWLPLNLPSVNLGGLTGFIIAWLANFKLLLFAFGKGPLSFDQNQNISVLTFLAVACMPIKIQQNQTQKYPQCGHNSEYLVAQNLRKGEKSFINYFIKALILALVLYLYQYNDSFNLYFIWLLYCCHIYIALEITLAILAALARATLGVELEPQFDEPYLSSSLQDFWGRRWNIMVTSILRPTVYDPVRRMSSRVIGSKWAPLPAVLAAFLTSALMHELIMYYHGRVTPTWEMTKFFLLHGVCVAVEAVVKKKFTGTWRLPRVLSGFMTVGFVIVTAFWLFLPPMIKLKVDTRALEEYAAVARVLKATLAADRWPSTLHVGD